VVDLFGAALALLVFGVPLAIAALAVRWTLGAPVLFRQQRPGLNGRPFTLFKLRTMRDGDEPDALRVTRLGRALRATSIDELPELWNVVRGDMSLVGPRPLLVQYLDRYTPRQARRHEVRPGITGLAQISGRNTASWDERLELDVRYVETHTLRMDFGIIARTIGLVLRRQGITAEGHASMPEFEGRGPT
jgi:lipopolysaccharide/colanic/teichoic acid biosynthesis glycosyltransferase